MKIKLWFNWNWSDLLAIGWIVFWLMYWFPQVTIFQTIIIASCGLAIHDIGKGGK